MKPKNQGANSDIVCEESGYHGSAENSVAIARSILQGLYGPWGREGIHVNREHSAE